MWYRIDMFKFSAMLLPPIMRKVKIFAFLKVLVSWFAQIQREFLAYREDARERMALNGQVIYIEKALNDYFLLQNPDIYISDISSFQRTFYMPEGQDTAFLYDSQSPKVTYISNESENAQLKFIVNVPSYLSDRIEEIRNIVDYNKPAGRTYTINIYNYE